VRVAVMIGLVGLGTAAVAYSTILDSGWVVSGVKASAAGTAGDGWIAFSNRVYYKSGGDSWEVFVVRPDGSGERRVTHSRKRLFDSYSPAWSPDGQRIVFHSRSHIFVIDETGEGLRQLTAARVNDDDPAWSREGGRIVFARIVFASGKDRSAIWVMRADGKQQHRLTPNGSDYEPAWSRDGRRIAFSRIKNASWTKADIWLIGAKGGRARKLIADGLSPSWSPDGSTPSQARAAAASSWSMQMGGADTGSATEDPPAGRPTGTESRSLVRAGSTSWTPMAATIIASAQAPRKCPAPHGAAVSARTAWGARAAWAAWIQRGFQRSRIDSGNHI
jgi:tricorn protease-like protein